MRKIHIDNIKPGQINGKTIYTYTQKQKLLGSGVPIKAEYIKRLKELGIYYIYVEDEISEGIDIEKMVPVEIQNQAVQSISHTMQIMNKGGKLEDVRPISKAVGGIIDTIINTKSLFVSVTDIRANDDYTFAHSVSVCTLSIILGMEMGLNELEIRDLGVGGLMHDLGKIEIPPEILNKPGKLTDEEMEIIKSHPQKGFDILRKCDILNRNTVNIALGHHERYDGSGYPNGYAKDEIHLFSRIVSVADVFDAMCADRVYHKGMDVNKVVKHLELMSGKHFDAEIVKKFIEKVIIYPNGSNVLLNTNEKAIVVKANLEEPDKPIVRVCTDPDGKLYNSFFEVDLSTNTQYSITRSCEGI